jgi:hypothetical protein
MDLRKEIEELRRLAGKDRCPACSREPIKLVLVPPGGERGDEEPCPVCGKKPTVIEWSNR